ncbi:hypothetical protein [Segniliparus rugosus]|uniref:Uncharacterized protein n=1 Tax=Segniliparus rugosus (strain ATCC BAA-974 / DSM 45345 / CCUG 50838 / CIP 108380 / JCM 13579 / CDC 945) TaxID=679197 RepID=E5XMC4_SEGRC|nr:hypothetical protein [Segniliparus rugosus]EFV14503.2 hypothetical protein HMPREF9336_00644 [Segniliparus rugosus ATCC BAA-974]
MSEVMTAARSGRAVPQRLVAGRVCSNAPLVGGVRRVSPGGAPAQKPGCARAPIKTVQPELPRVSGASAMLTAVLLVAIAFGVLFLGSWRQSSVEGVSDQQGVPAHAAEIAAQADGAEGPGRE